MKNGWFSETGTMWKGVSLSIKIEKVLCRKRSKYQKIEVFKTTSCGKMLVLDGMIQATEMDEFAYQEMLTHVPMCSHPSPERVLVIGGGDGGILREVARHNTVKEIDICEIDEEVINVCKTFIPSMGCGFDDSRVNVHIADGSAFIKKRLNYYDVIIVDSSDPVGPAETLFRESFYTGMKNALRKNGIIAAQSESFFLHGKIVRSLMDICRGLFPVAEYSYIMVPTYPGGGIGICVGSLGPDVKQPARLLAAKIRNQLRYYNPEIHQASFILPQIGKKLLAKKL